MNQQDYEKLEESIKIQPFSQYFAAEDYEQFRKVFKERGFKKGQKILWRGQKGFFFFIIGTGKISVRVTGEDKKEKIVAHLGPGDYVGEISLLYNRPRVADCYAEEDNTLLFLLAQRPFFDVFVAKPEVRQSIEAIASSRMQETKKISANASGPEAQSSGSDDADAGPAPSLQEPAAPPPVSDMETVRASGPESAAAGTLPISALEEMTVDFPPLSAGIVPATEEILAPPDSGIVFPDDIPPLAAAIVPAEEGSVLPLKGGIAFPDDIPPLAEPENPEAARGLDLLKGLCEEKRLKSGDMMDLAQEGSPFFVIDDGEIAVKEPLTGGEIMLGAGEFFGEIPLIIEFNPGFQCRATRDSLIYVPASREKLEEMLNLPGIREELEAKAMRRIFGKGLRTLSTVPAVESYLKKKFKDFKVAFYAQ